MIDATGPSCSLPIADAERRARICGALAITTRDVEGVTFSACANCAAALDARGTPAASPAVDLIPYLAAARSHVHGDGRFRRIVVRMAPRDVARLDAVRARLPKASRAAIVRAFTLAGLAALQVPAAQEGGAP